MSRTPSPAPAPPRSTPATVGAADLPTTAVNLLAKRAATTGAQPLVDVLRDAGVLVAAISPASAVRFVSPPSGGK